MGIVIIIMVVINFVILMIGSSKLRRTKSNSDAPILAMVIGAILMTGGELMLLRATDF